MVGTGKELPEGCAAQSVNRQERFRSPVTTKWTLLALSRWPIANRVAWRISFGRLQKSKMRRMRSNSGDNYQVTVRPALRVTLNPK